jgi:hypothetical protein
MLFNKSNVVYHVDDRCYRETRKSGHHMLGSQTLAARVDLSATKKLSDIMTVVLGKRKRRELLNSQGIESPDAINSAHIQALFKKHFEEKYEPLPETAPAATLHHNADIPTLSSTEDSDSWDGLSDGEHNYVQIIEHSTSSQSQTTTTRQERKTFMVPLPTHLKLLPL